MLWHRRLARLESAHAALSHSAPGLGRDEAREVLEELSNSGALLATIKKDLDSIHTRLRGMRQALAAAFPQHVQPSRRQQLETELEQEDVRQRPQEQSADVSRSDDHEQPADKRQLGLAERRPESDLPAAQLADRSAVAQQQGLDRSQPGQPAIAEPEMEEEQAASSAEGG
jgi:hypothetical protein